MYYIPRKKRWCLPVCTLRERAALAPPAGRASRAASLLTGGVVNEAAVLAPGRQRRARQPCGQNTALGLPGRSLLVDPVAGLSSLEVRAVADNPVGAAQRLLRARPLEHLASVLALLLCKGAGQSFSLDLKCWLVKERCGVHSLSFIVRVLTVQHAPWLVAVAAGKGERQIVPASG